jgi:hypothetical protein
MSSPSSADGTDPWTIQCRDPCTNSEGSGEKIGGEKLQAAEISDPARWALQQKSTKLQHHIDKRES